MARAIDADRLLLVLEKNFGHTGGAAVMRQLIEIQPTLPQPSNEPLTPEELREMDGNPVWIEHDEDPQYNHVWMIWNNEIGFRHDLAGYNIFWRAYRYPLVGEDGA